ncbi:collagen alpha-1(IX) chain, partial [Biomphalaria glabrata]
NRVYATVSETGKVDIFMNNVGIQAIGHLVHPDLELSYLRLLFKRPTSKLDGNYNCLARFVTKSNSTMAISSKSYRVHLDKMKKEDCVILFDELLANVNELQSQQSICSEGILNIKTQIAEIKRIPGPPGLPGRDGDPGLPGYVGLRGDPGHIGALGLPGQPGDIGRNGHNGMDGIMGQPGAKGPKGDPGVPGQPGPKGLKGEPNAGGRMNK